MYTASDASISRAVFLTAAEYRLQGSKGWLVTIVLSGNYLRSQLLVLGHEGQYGGNTRAVLLSWIGELGHDVRICTGKSGSDNSFG